MESTSKEYTCCFVGHRKINKTDELKKKLYKAIEHLIVKNNVDIFLFGSKSDFNDLCYETVTHLKEQYPHIKRIYMRAEFPYIDDSYKDYLLESYEDTYYLSRMTNAGKAAYIERNYEMIDSSNYCVLYYDENYAPPRRKSSKTDLSSYQPRSGTKIAYDYAVKRGIEIINIIEKQVEKTSVPKMS